MTYFLGIAPVFLCLGSGAQAPRSLVDREGSAGCGGKPKIGDSSMEEKSWEVEAASLHGWAQTVWDRGHGTRMMSLRRCSTPTVTLTQADLPMPQRGNVCHSGVSLKLLVQNSAGGEILITK